MDILTVRSVRCERCGTVVEIRSRKDADDYCWTGRCWQCVAALGTTPSFIGMVENILEVR